MSGAAQPANAGRDAFKRSAAEAAVTLFEPGMVVGLATGSAAAFAIEALARRHRQGLGFLAIPTSKRTAAQEVAAGAVSLTSLAQDRLLDLTIDGADKVEHATLNLIKGLDGELLHEKIVAAASRHPAIVIDATKLVDRLTTNVPVPVEVVAFGLEATISCPRA